MTQPSETRLPRVFGVRHLSPASAWHVLRVLDEHRPSHVLLEAPQDTLETLMALSHPGVVPPVALLVYTEQMPVSSLLYPLAQYSPEFQVVQWVAKHQKTLHAIDLPAGLTLAARQQKQVQQLEESTDVAPSEPASETLESHASINHFDHLARAFGESDYDSYWERYFEHQTDTVAFIEQFRHIITEARPAIDEQTQTLMPERFAHDHLRESYMVSCIQNLLNQGVDPDDMLVIVGAYHVPAIESALSGQADWTPISPQALSQHECVPIKQVLMPYSYQRLSQQSGYGAGNHAPYYFESLWQHLQTGTRTQLPAYYVTQVARLMREQGHYASSASVIEAVRLAQALSVFRFSGQAVLSDLEDAVRSLLGEGEWSRVMTAIVQVNHGRRIGQVPEGVGQTPLQDDFKRTLASLKLTDFYVPYAQVLRLDLRENRQVKSQHLAWLDLNRSTFLHRLSYLGIEFGRYAAGSETNAWVESWSMNWSPEAEIQLAESSLKGETIEYACNFAMREALKVTHDSAGSGFKTIAQIVHHACLCQLPGVFTDALDQLQSMVIEHVPFEDAVTIAEELSRLAQYGDWRRVQTHQVRPLLAQLFNRACLILPASASCDDQTARTYLPLIAQLDAIAQRHFQEINAELWQSTYVQLAFNDQINSLISGACFALVLENNQCSDEQTIQEVSLRLSVGNPVSLAGAWFEGLASRNRFALLSRQLLWECLDRYLAHLDDDGFHHALISLRRTFSQFDQNQINTLASTLALLWKQDAEEVAEQLQAPLSESEKNKLDELNDFDFDF